jgi:hypothetical protein
MSIDQDFANYCRQCTDAQLAEVLRREYGRFRHGDYDSAMVVAGERGWSVVNGERQ